MQVNALLIPVNANQTLTATVNITVVIARCTYTAGSGNVHMGVTGTFLELELYRPAQCKVIKCAIGCCGFGVMIYVLSNGTNRSHVTATINAGQYMTGTHVNSSVTKNIGLVTTAEHVAINGTAGHINLGIECYVTGFTTAKRIRQDMGTRQDVNL